MPRKGENIRKRSDGRWEGRFIYKRDSNGTAKYRSIYGHSYSEVKRKLWNEKKNAEVDMEPINTNMIPFERAAELWMSKNELYQKKSTIIKYREQLNKHLLPEFSGVMLSSISEPLVAEFLRKKSSELSNSSLRTLLTIIKSIFRYGASQKWCQARFFNLSLPSSPLRKPNALNNSERQCLEEFLTDEMNLVKLGVYICLFTGLRIGELCALRWSDINLVDNILTVSYTLQRLQRSSPVNGKRTEIILSQPKSASSKRTIPLPYQLVNYLKPFQTQNTYFLLTGSEKPMEPRTMQYRFKKYAQQLNLSCSNMHSLRHTFATHCIEIGFDAKTLSEILGHARVDITLNRYVHSSDEYKRTQMMLLYSNSGQKDGRTSSR